MPILVGNAAHLRTLAKSVVETAHAAEEIGRDFVVGTWRGVAEVDAARNAAPRIGARNVPCRNLDELFCAPMRDRAWHFGASPRQRGEHPSVRTRERGHGGCGIRALHGEPTPWILRRLDRCLQRCCRRLEPSNAVEAHLV